MKKLRLTGLILMFGPIFLIFLTAFINLVIALIFSLLMSLSLFSSSSAEGLGMAISLFPLMLVIVPLSVAIIPAFLIGLVIFVISSFSNNSQTDINPTIVDFSGKEASKWNWGAAGIPYIWGPYYGLWSGLLGLVPVLNILWFFVMGSKGNKWIEGRYPGNAYIVKESQDKWKLWGILSIGSLFGSIFAFVFVLILINQLGIFQYPSRVLNLFGLKKEIAGQVIAKEPITVISPNGGESWPIGSTQIIRWDPQGLLPETKIDIEFYEEGTDPRYATTISSGLAASSTEHTWTVFDTIAPNKNYLVKVSALYEGRPVASDSSKSFMVVQGQ